MTERLEQRYCIKFCQNLGDSQVETIRKIQTAFGDDSMGITQIKEWYNRFKDGRILEQARLRQIGSLLWKLKRVGGRKRRIITKEKIDVTAFLVGFA
ncbi:hypothetical protein J437_LFUL006501 [Ladona fulva]|uniref:Mos1 transposase HTH domain-containing protein n=1 Tax=Ladona fulva TaxID=123851 RepID=A0A8K0K3E8_LADFU|nr:hypothetical protein J437_LFUL006501 [Ladona fulva]